jgi:VWFA-related protein
MADRRTFPIRPLVALALAVLVAGTVAAGQDGRDATIFVAVVDQDGKPVKDVRHGEILVREDGTDREVMSVRPASQPLYVALLVDTTPGTEEYIRDIRNAFVAFARHVATASPESRLSLTEFGQAAVRTAPFTTDVQELEKSINRVFPKPRAASVLLEALIAASDDLAKQPSRRRAIVAFNMEPSDEQSREEPRRLQEALRKSGAQVWSVSLQKGTQRNASRDLLLSQLTKNTGGRREYIVAQSAIETYMKLYADALLSQYEVTYKRPSSARSQVVQTGTTRSGVRLHASGYAPQ